MIDHKINQFPREIIPVIGTDCIIDFFGEPNRNLMITFTHRNIFTVFINIKVIHIHHLLKKCITMAEKTIQADIMTDASKKPRNGLTSRA